MPNLVDDVGGGRVASKQRPPARRAHAFRFCRHAARSSREQRAESRRRTAGRKRRAEHSFPARLRRLQACDVGVQVPRHPGPLIRRPPYQSPRSRQCRYGDKPSCCSARKIESLLSLLVRGARQRPDAPVPSFRSRPEREWRRGRGGNRRRMPFSGPGEWGSLTESSAATMNVSRFSLLVAGDPLPRCEQLGWLLILDFGPLSLVLWGRLSLIIHLFAYLPLRLV